MQLKYKNERTKKAIHVHVKVAYSGSIPVHLRFVTKIFGQFLGSSWAAAPVGDKVLYNGEKFRPSVRPPSGPQTPLAGLYTSLAGPRTSLVDPHTSLAGPLMALAVPPIILAGPPTPLTGPQPLWLALRPL